MKNRLFSIGILIIIAAVFTGCSTAGHYYKEGKKNFESGRYENAAESFHKAIRQNPNRADYYIGYGETLIALGQYKKALSQLDRAYMNKDMSIIRQNDKRILRAEGIAYYKMQNYKKAIKEFDKALEISELPKLNLDILYYKGSSLRAAGSYQMAIKVYQKILSGNKKNATAYADRALCYRCMGAYRQSLADYNKAISLDTDNYEYYFGKYNLLMEHNDASAAEAVLDQAAKISADTDQDKYNLAKVRYLQGNYDSALTDFGDSLNKGFREAGYYLGEIYRSKKDYPKAVYYYDNYIKAGNVSAPDVYNQAAVCLFKTDDYEKAVKYLEKGIAYNDTGTLQVLKKNEIIAYEHLGNFSKANDKLKDYLKSYPDDKDAVREAEFIKTRLISVSTEDSSK